MIQVICICTKPYLTGEGFRTDGTFTNLTLGRRYKAEEQQGPQPRWFRVWDDYGEDYLYPPHMFEVCNGA